MQDVCGVCDELKKKAGVSSSNIVEYKYSNNAYLPNDREETNLIDWSNNLEKLKAKKFPFYRPIDVVEMKISLFKSLILPELGKGIKLPAPFSIPTYSFQQKNSFQITLSANGNAWVQVNMGQFLDSGAYKNGTTSLNGVSVIGNSSVFFSNDASLNGTTNLSPVATGGVCQALNINSVPAGTFNAIRAGPMCVKYEYTGRLDNSSGIVSMVGVKGLNYTQVTDATAGATGNANVYGLLPDVNYTILTAIEDCPFARTVSITEGLKAIFIPQDYTLMNLKNPTDSSSTVVPQRLFILITGGPASQVGAARITITQNWEAIPTRTTQDYITCSYNPYPSDFDPRQIFEYMIANNLVITKDDSEFGLMRFENELKQIYK